ncbi:MAG TPA: retroviral-like aspartic protease family protein [Gemmatimonadaceae bacterium]
MVKRLVPPRNATVAREEAKRYMIDDMGIFRTTIAVEHPAARGTLRSLSSVMVDTGSEYTWIPSTLLEELGVKPERAMRFSLADGSIIERPIGFAIIHAGGTSAVDIVVFASERDKTLLGAHSLEGLNLRLDLVRKELVPAGPVEAALCS